MADRIKDWFDELMLEEWGLCAESFCVGPLCTAGRAADA